VERHIQSAVCGTLKDVDRFKILTVMLIDNQMISYDTRCWLVENKIMTICKKHMYMVKVKR
jgi:hypothetical protein